MQRINLITMRGIKSANGTQELTGRDIIIGHNGAGKTTRAQAIGISLLGYVPGGGKLPAETMKLAAGDRMVVGLDTETFYVERTFSRIGTKIEQAITVTPPDGEKTIAEKEKRIERELGKLPVMLDFNDFLNQSDMKRREFIYSLAGSDEVDGEGKSLVEILRERVSLPDTADPLEKEILAGDIAECAEQYAPGANIRAGLQAMLDHAKEQTSFWKKEREKSAGAAQKMTEYKNDLAETDRNLDADTKRLEELQTEYTRVSSELATANNENLQIISRNEKIDSLRAEIAALETETNTVNVAELRELIAQYGADIRQVDNSAAISMANERMEALRGQLLSLEQAVERCRDEYLAVKNKKMASEDLVNKISQQTGQCPIDCRITCDKDFTNLVSELTAEIDGYAAKMREITQNGTEAKATLNNAREAVKDAQDAINGLRLEEVSALRENEQIQAIIREYESEIAQAESFDTTKAARLRAKRDELTGALPAGGGEWKLQDTNPRTWRKSELETEIPLLKDKITEATKTRNALATIKNSLIDTTVAGYHAEGWKRITEAVGPKGLQGELVKDALAPLIESINDKSSLMRIDKTFYIETEDDKGKEIFQFGWEDSEGSRRNFDALSTGEQMLLLIAMMTTIIERLDPPLKMLIIDNAENLDTENLRRVLYGLTVAGKQLDNIIFLGVMDVKQESFSDWRVWNLGGGAE